MADGYTRPPPIAHADGVYLDLPLSEYLRDRALSGSGLKKLAACPPDWWWEHPDNELWDEPESDARALGTLVHCAVLEGLDAYGARYCVKPEPPEGALVTCEDLQDWLRVRAGEPLPIDLEPEHYSNFGKKSQSLRLNGSRDELVKRVRLLDSRAPIWEHDLDQLLAGRVPVGAKADKYVRLVERFIRTDPAYAPLLTGGLAEVSIFWSEGQGRERVRYKARLDYLGPEGVLDLKKFGQPPAMGRSLIQHVLREAASYGYDVQAVHNVRAAEAAAELLSADNLDFTAQGPGARERIDCCGDLLRGFRSLHHKGEAIPFRWLFVRTPGAPVAIAPEFTASDRFGNSNLVWDAAKEKIERAVAHFHAYRAQCGDEMWLRSDGLVTPDISDWPLWATEVASA